MVDVASLSVSLQINLGNMASQLERVKQSTEGLAKSMQAAFSQVSQLSQTASTSLGNTAQNLRQAADQIRQAGTQTTQSAATMTAGMQRIEQSSGKAGDAVERTAGDISRTLRDAMIRLDKTVTDLQKSITGLANNLKNANVAMQETAQASKRAAGGLLEVQQKQQDVVSGSANLGRFMRVLTTNILGVNSVAIALGTALGNLATQLVSRLVLGLIQSVTQFGNLRNALASSAATIGNVGREMEFITQQAAISGRSISEVSTAWINLAERARRAHVSIEDARKAFDQWNRSTARVRQRTVSESFRNLGNAVGEFIAKLDRATGASNTFNYVLNKIAQGVRDLSEGLPSEPEVDKLQQLEQELQSVRDRLNEVLTNTLKIDITLENWLKNWGQIGQAIRTGVQLFNLGPVARDMERIKQLEQEIFELRWRGGVLAKERTDEELVMMEAIEEKIRHRLSTELGYAGKTRTQREILVRLAEIENEYRQAGIELNAQERLFLVWKYEQQLKTIQALEIERERRLATAAQDAQINEQILTGQRGLIEDIMWSYDQYQQKVLEVEKNIRDSHELTYEQELAINEFRIREQERLQRAYWDTAQQLGQTLTALFPKSKAAAIANALINTAEGVTMALAKGGPPPLNFIQAGLVAAAGMAQIASIRSTNLSGSGSIPRPSGSSTGAQPATGPAAPPTGALILNIPRGDIWSSEAVAELIGRINDEVQNGRTLISTRTVPF